MLKTIQTFACNLSKDENGTALLEYSILLGIIIVTVIGLVIGVGNWVNSQWSTFCNGLKSGNNQCKTA